MTAILLPPSEAKRPGGAGPSLTELGDDGPLAVARGRVARAVARLAAGRPERAAAALLLPASLAPAALAADRTVLESATVPALDRYAGVVYDGLDVASLSVPERAVADAVVHVFSGLRGVVRGGEPVCDYRVPAAATLPRLGVAATWWRPVLQRAVPRLLPEGPVLDLRSTDYLAMWRAGPEVLSARVLTRRPDGSTAVVSHNSKHAKGRLTRHLIRHLAAGGTITGPDDVAEAWIAAGGHDAQRPGPTRLDLIE